MIQEQKAQKQKIKEIENLTDTERKIYLTNILVLSLALIPLNLCILISYIKNFVNSFLLYKFLTAISGLSFLVFLVIIIVPLIREKILEKSPFEILGFLKETTGTNHFINFVFALAVIFVILNFGSNIPKEKITLSIFTIIYFSFSALLNHKISAIVEKFEDIGKFKEKLKEESKV